MLEQIKSLYQIEYEAANLGILHSEEHREMRISGSGHILGELKQYLLEQSGKHALLLSIAVTARSRCFLSLLSSRFWQFFLQVDNSLGYPPGM